VKARKILNKIEEFSVLIKESKISRLERCLSVSENHDKKGGFHIFIQ
jgi:hypothetical protein